MGLPSLDQGWVGREVQPKLRDEIRLGMGYASLSHGVDLRCYRTGILRRGALTGMGREFAFRVHLREQTVRSISADGARCSPKKQ